jgi:DNA polymerase elongation subunit (family B)
MENKYQKEYDTLIRNLGGNAIILEKPLKFRKTPHSKDIFIYEILPNYDVELYGDAMFTVLQKLRLLKSQYHINNQFIIDVGLDVALQFPNIENPRQPIIYITFLDINSDNIITYSTNESIENSIHCESELEILQLVNVFISNKSLIGYNIDKFDLPYLRNRMREKYQIKLNNYESFDIFHLIKQLKPETDNYSLPSICNYYGVEYKMVSLNNTHQYTQNTKNLYLHLKHLGLIQN